MDFDNLCMPSDPACVACGKPTSGGRACYDCLTIKDEPLRGQPEMTPPEALTLPGATAAYIAKLEARVAELEALCVQAELPSATLVAWAHMSNDERLRVCSVKLIDALDEKSADNTELVGWRDGVFVHPDTQETIRRLADELAMHKAAFAEAGLEMYPQRPGDGLSPPAGVSSVSTSHPEATAVSGAFSAPALMSGPYPWYGYEGISE